jgi:uncharacterized RDD family membrane protein YckC
MRCPKCHYLSFDPEPRCKNCGYDLEVADADLALKTTPPAADEDEPFDLKLRDTVEPERVPAMSSGGEDRLTIIDEPEDGYGPSEPEIQLRTDEDELVEAFLEDITDVGPEVPAPAAPPPAPVAPSPVMLASSIEAPARPARQRPGAARTALLDEPARRAPIVERPDPEPRRSPITTTEMPLFVKAIPDRDPEPVPAPPPAPPVPVQRERELPDEAELVRHFPPVAAPRPPLAVRRSAIEPPAAAPAAVRRSPERRLGPLDHDLLEDLKRVEREEAAQSRADARSIGMTLAEAEQVEPRRRVAAAAIDTVVLGGIALFVFWATLRMCQVSVFDLPVAALVPLLIFLISMDVGYLLMFTAAGGQTFGKMLFGIRVVGDDDGRAYVSLRQASWRAVLSVVGLGLGWLPALFGRGLALHDKIAHTRVVRA